MYAHTPQRNQSCTRHAEAEQTGFASLNLVPVPHSGNGRKSCSHCTLSGPAFVQTPTETLECATQLTDDMWARQDRRSPQGKKKVTEYICKTVLFPAMLESVTVETCLAVGATLQQDVRKRDLLLYINVLFWVHLSCKITRDPGRD